MNGFLIEHRFNGNRGVSASYREVFPIYGIIGNNIGDFVSFHGNKYNILMEKHDDGDNILMILGKYWYSLVVGSGKKIANAKAF